MLSISPAGPPPWEAGALRFEGEVRRRIVITDPSSADAIGHLGSVVAVLGYKISFEFGGFLDGCERFGALSAVAQAMIWPHNHPAPGRTYYSWGCQQDGGS